MVRQGLCVDRPRSGDLADELKRRKCLTAGGLVDSGRPATPDRVARCLSSAKKLRNADRQEAATLFAMRGIVVSAPRLRRLRDGLRSASTRSMADMGDATCARRSVVPCPLGSPELEIACQAKDGRWTS